MRIYKRLNNKNILLIFGGFASHPSHFTPFIPNNCGLILLYNYSHLDFTKLNEILSELKDSKITLIAFSMGVFVARVFLESSSFKFHKKIAINGTECGICEQYGIPLKIFRLTQKTFDLEKFKQNLFSEFLSNARDFVFLDSTILKEELLFFINSCARISTIQSAAFWDFAIISARDLIFNVESQRKFWELKQTRIVELDLPHFVFFAFSLENYENL